MTSERRPVMAAPNRCRLTASVVELHDDPDAPGKQTMRIEIRESEGIQGANFARVGAVVDAFTFEPPPGVAPGATLRSEAEYLGGPQAGRFQLHGPQVVDSA